MSTITLTVETDEVSMDPAGPLQRIAALYRALLSAGYDAEMETEVDDERQLARLLERVGGDN